MKNPKKSDRPTGTKESNTTISVDGNEGFFKRERAAVKNEDDLHALKKAALKLEKLLISQGITEEELFAEFHALRERNKD
jgi:hypothetical protein